MQQRALKTRVIHHCVPPVSLKLADGIKEVFSAKVSIRSGGFDGLANPAHDFYVELLQAMSPQHVSHVHAPTICRPGWPEPAPKNRIISGINQFAQLLAGIIQLGQRAKPHP